MAVPKKAKVTVEVLAAHGDDGTLGLAIAAIQEAIDQLSEERGITVIKSNLEEHRRLSESQVKGLLVRFSKTIAFDVYLRGGNVFEVIDALTTVPNLIVGPTEVASLETIRTRAKKLVSDWFHPSLLEGMSIPQMIGIGLIGAVGVQLLWQWKYPKAA